MNGLMEINFHEMLPKQSILYFISQVKQMIFHFCSQSC